MIKIEKNTTNRCIVTLTEKQTLLVSDWVFEFINDQTQEKVVFTCVDESLNTCRYNQFTITETSSDTNLEDLYNGVVVLNGNGYWSYTVYEMTPNSPVDLDVTNAVGIAETGKVYVFETGTNPNSFSLTEDSNTIKAFNDPD